MRPTMWRRPNLARQSPRCPNRARQREHRPNLARQRCGATTPRPPREPAGSAPQAPTRSQIVPPLNLHRRLIGTPDHIAQVAHFLAIAHQIDVLAFRVTTILTQGSGSGMKLRSAVVWGGAGCGRDPDMQGVVGRLADMQGVVGQNPDTRSVVGRLLDMQGVVGRYFAIFRALSVRISPEDSRTVRNAPDNVAPSESRPTIPALSESCPTTRAPPKSRPATLRRNHATTAARTRRLRTAGADPQPDRSAAKSSSPSHRHPRSHCAGCPLPCNRPPDRRSCLSAQSAQDCIQPS